MSSQKNQPNHQNNPRNDPTPNKTCSTNDGSLHFYFNIGEPLAYFLTWTTYGTWLPGDERGWNRKGEPEILPPNALFVEMAQSQLKEPSFTLSTKSRTLVEETIRRHCEIRGWALHALNEESRHPQTRRSEQSTSASALGASRRSEADRIETTVV